MKPDAAMTVMSPLYRPRGSAWSWGQAGDRDKGSERLGLLPCRTTCRRAGCPFRVAPRFEPEDGLQEGHRAFKPRPQTVKRPPLGPTRHPPGHHRVGVPNGPRGHQRASPCAMPLRLGLLLGTQNDAPPVGFGVVKLAPEGPEPGRRAPPPGPGERVGMGLTELRLVGKGEHPRASPVDPTCGPHAPVSGALAAPKALSPAVPRQ